MEAPAIEEWRAKQAIAEVIYRYCRAVDRLDRDLAVACWHSEGTAEYRGMYEGPAAGLLDWIWRQHRQLIDHSHQVTNVLIEVAGERAASEAYVTATLRSAAGERVVDRIYRGRYLDRWSRRRGAWAIDHRIFVADLGHAIEVAPDLSGPGAGRRDREDPSYEVLRSVRQGTGPTLR